jgi:hypothetical protein
MSLRGRLRPPYPGVVIEPDAAYLFAAPALLVGAVLKVSWINTALPPTRTTVTAATAHQTFHIATARSSEGDVGSSMDDSSVYGFSRRQCVRRIQSF